VLFQKQRVFAVKAHRLASISGKSAVELVEAREEQLADARAHVGFVGDLAMQGPRAGADAGVEREDDR
jgi:hypothetical protein